MKDWTTELCHTDLFLIKGIYSTTVIVPDSKSTEIYDISVHICTACLCKDYNDFYNSLKQLFLSGVYQVYPNSLNLELKSCDLGCL